MASNYNRRLLAPEVLVDDGAWTLISPPADHRRSAGVRSRMARGLLVVFEGLDQSGKQTQAEALRDRLVSRGRVVRLLSFPTYETHIGAEIGRALHGARLRSRRDAAALRRQPVRVEAGDRARAGRGDGADMRSLPGVEHRLRRSARPEPEVAARGSAPLPQPDLTVLLDMSPDVSARASASARLYDERDLRSKRACAPATSVRRASTTGRRSTRRATAWWSPRTRRIAVSERLSHRLEKTPLPEPAARRRGAGACASVRRRTSPAPIDVSTRAHSDNVAPVVRTSSTSTTTRPAINAARCRAVNHGDAANAPWTLRRRCTAGRPTCARPIAAATGVHQRRDRAPPPDRQPG